MKTVNLYLFAVIAAFLFIGCEDNSEELQEVFYPTNVDYGNTPLGLSPELNLIAGDGVTNKPVTLYAAKQMPWRFSDLPSWLSFSQQSGRGISNLTYTAEQNPSVTVERTAYFFLESELGNLPLHRTLSAHQLTQPKSFTVAPDEPSYTFGHEGGTLVLNVKSNQKWSISQAAGEVVFAKLSHTKDSADAVVTVTIPPYNSLVVRTQSNTFRFVDASSTNVLYEFRIDQTPPAVSSGLLEETMTFSKDGERQSLSLGIAPSYTVQCDLAWANVTPTSGIGEVKLNISTLPNWSTSERSGYVYVYVEGELKAKIFIVQKACQFILHKSSHHVEVNGGTFAFDMLTSDGVWQAVTEDDWVKVTPTTGGAGEKQTISFSVLPNNSLDSRTATICFERTDNVVSRAEFTIVQQGHYFSAGDWTKGVVIGPEEQTILYEFNSDLSWTASTNVQWISLITTTGPSIEGQTLSFSVAANTSREVRMGEIVITYDGGTTTIPVMQESSYLNSSSESVVFASTGGDHAISISFNGTWSVESDAEWLTFSNTSGNGPIELILTATDNPSEKSRTAEVVFTLGGNGVQRKLIITQKGHFLYVPVTVVNFYMKGGEYRCSNINSDGKLLATSSESWLQATIEAGNTLVLKAEKNEWKVERTATVTISLSNVISDELKRTITVYQDINESVTVNDVTFNMIFVKGGAFYMGSDTGDEDERPVHSVTLTKDYFIGETEVTQELWETVMGSLPESITTWWNTKFMGKDKPVAGVSWDIIHEEFLPKLNSLTGLNFRLPTEAEWEYAARGGYKSKGYKYSGSNTINRVAWYWDNTYVDDDCWNYFNNVGSLSPNELGIYDMSGNVSEWCEDWYDSDYYNNSPSVDPCGPSGLSSREERVARGGCMYDEGYGCRITRRGYDRSSADGENMGFRLALTIE